MTEGRDPALFPDRMVRVWSVTKLATGWRMEADRPRRTADDLAGLP